jgi:hypothetical protein
MVDIIRLPKLIDTKPIARQYNEVFIRSSDLAHDLGVSRLLVEYLTGSLTMPVRLESDLYHLQFGLNFTHF